MTEREMENLIAAFPSDFFPRRNFVLKGRQQSFADVGRFDLLFEDEFQTKILMELKARCLPRIWPHRNRDRRIPEC
jgi:hypothetical protein